ncbi:MAG: nitroreductase [Clostridiales bacterium]|jgi:nitroreductase|nr:nitroreductase [Clostridiales bacterium]
MEFLELARARHSTRGFSGTPVEPGKLEKILEAARLAPSAHNYQAYKLLVVQSEEGLAKIAKAGNIHGAPAAIIVFEDSSRAWTNPYNNRQLVSHDSVIATDHMMLEATDLGLDSLWVCWFDPAVIKAEFDAPENLEPINILALGYSSRGGAPPKQRKELGELVSYEKL